MCIRDSPRGGQGPLAAEPTWATNGFVARAFHGLFQRCPHSRMEENWSARSCAELQLYAARQQRSACPYIHTSEKLDERTAGATP
eukprot:5090715-Alexandrium_andersonii.AAC.1